MTSLLGTYLFGDSILAEGLCSCWSSIVISMFCVCDWGEFDGSIEDSIDYCGMSLLGTLTGETTSGPLIAYFCDLILELFLTLVLSTFTPVPFT